MRKASNINDFTVYNSGKKLYNDKVKRGFLPFLYSFYLVRGLAMKELVTLYIGTCILAVLSQHYNPGDLSNQYRVRRHFFRDHVDIFALIIIIWATLFSGLRLSYNDSPLSSKRQKNICMTRHLATGAVF